jgi:hypothetical protein
MFKRLLIMAVAITVIFLPLNTIAEDNIANSTNRDERLNKAVADQQIVLDESTKAFLQSKCQSAQLILSNIQNETEGLIRKRLDTYSDIQKELQAIKLRMIRQGADASETDLLTGKIQQSLDAFTIQADRYGTSLDDVVLVDCVQKPEQFKTALLLMRTQRSKLLDLANELKSIMNGSDNNVFKQLKKRLII